MTEKELERLFLSRQSCRAFSQKPVTKAQIEKICSLAALAPSACNMQPWRVYAITGEKLEKTREILLAAGKAPFVKNVPAFLVIVEDGRASALREKRLSLPYYVASDTGEFTAHLLLAAEAAGLSACLLGWSDRDEGINALVDLPEGAHIPFLLAIGYAEDGYEVRPKTRRPLEETLFFAD